MPLTRVARLGRVTRVVAVAAAAGAAGGCAEPGGGGRCGPARAQVARVIDGDTIELAGGARVRYLLVDAPETSGGAPECFGENAARFNTDLVLGRTVGLRYDAACEDAFGRALAYVEVDGQDVSRLIVERGFGCVLHVPGSGDDRAAELRAVEAAARAARRGVWGACDPVPCT